MLDLDSEIGIRFPQFKKLDIAIGGSILQKSDYDFANALIVQDFILDSINGDRFAILLPEDPLNRTLFLTSAVLACLLQNVVEQNDHLENLSPDDPVEVIMQGKRKAQAGTYLGREIRYDEEYFVVDVKGCKHFVPLKNRQSIRPVKSRPTKTQRRILDIHGMALEHAYELPAGGLLSLQRSKIMFVTNDKAGLCEEIRSVSIGNDQWEDLFPISEYYGENMQIGRGRNPHKLERTIGLVSHLDIAARVALADKAQRVIICDDPCKVRKSLTSLERLHDEVKPPKILVLMNPRHESEIECLTANGFRIWAWSPSDFKRHQKPYFFPADACDSFTRHGHVVKCLQVLRDERIDVEYPPSITSDVADLLADYRRMYRALGDNLDVRRALNPSFYLLKEIFRLPLPISIYDAYLDSTGQAERTIKARFENCRSRLAGMPGNLMAEGYRPAIEQMLAKYERIIEVLGSESPKLERIMDSIERRNGSMCVVCDRYEHAKALQNHIRYREGVIFLDQSHYPIGDFRDVLVTGWFDSGFSRKILLPPTASVTTLQYPVESLERYHYSRKSPLGPDSALDKELRSTLFNGAFSREEGTQNVKPPDSGSESLTPLYTAPEVLDEWGEFEGGMGEAKKSAYHIRFDNGFYCHVSENSHIDKLTREPRGIVSVNSNEVEPGDELIFASGSRTQFETILSAINDSPRYRQIAAVAALWKEALIQYMQDQRLDVDDLTLKLEENGCARKPITIQKWLDGLVIRPLDEECNVLEVIIKMTENQKLKSHLAEVEAACTQVRAAHMKAGILLVDLILNAAIGVKDDELGLEVVKDIREYATSAKILIVENISGPNDVAISRIGKIHDPTEA